MLIPRIVGLFTIVFFLKSRLIFNVFCCFGVFVNNPCLTKVGVSQNVKWFVMPNLRYTIFMWRFIYFMNFISALCLVPTAGITFVALVNSMSTANAEKSIEYTQISFIWSKYWANIKQLWALEILKYKQLWEQGPNSSCL